MGCVFSSVSKNEETMFSFWAHCKEISWLRPCTFRRRAPDPDISAKQMNYLLHLTSRRPCQWSKTKKRQPCWRSKPVSLELNSIFKQNLFFDSAHQYGRWPRERTLSVRPKQTLHSPGLENHLEHWFSGIIFCSVFPLRCGSTQRRKSCTRQQWEWG